MRRERDATQVLPEFEIRNVQSLVGAGSLVAIFTLRVAGLYLPNAKYFHKNGRGWVGCSHKSDRGDWVTDVSFDDALSDNIASAIAARLGSTTE
jgi:hypothetical protein